MGRVTFVRLLDIAGGACLVVAAWLAWPALGLAVLGALCLATAYVLEPRGAAR